MVRYSCQEHVLLLYKQYCKTLKEKLGAYENSGAENISIPVDYLLIMIIGF